MRVNRIGRYEVVSQVGRGGMGTVYRARDPELGRDVALKLLEGGSTQQRSRFAREAEGLARLQHPNVVRVHEAGEDGERSYLVMELVEGEDLQQRLDRDGPFDADEAARIGRDLAGALEQAHRLGILHRDLKPSNVLIRPDGRPLMTDFGLAHLGEAERLTRTGTSLGTPGFWPPEQATGKRAQVGPASDVYGLGATLYALLCGRPPVEGSTVRELLVATCEQRPAPLRGVDPALEAIVQRCLAKAPEERYTSAAALQQALDDYLAGGRSTPAGRGVALGVTAAAGLLLLGGAASWLVTRPAATGQSDSIGSKEGPAASAREAALSKLVDLLEVARDNQAPHRWRAAEAALEALPGRLDARTQRTLEERGGGRLVVLRLYREGRLPEALQVAKAAAGKGDAWCGRASGALSVVEEGRRAFARPLQMFANMSRRDAPAPGSEGLLLAWVALAKTLEARETISPQLGRVRDLARAELRVTAVGALYLLNGPARDHAGEREAFRAVRKAVDLLQTTSPRAYDGLRALEKRIQTRTWTPASGDPDLEAAVAELTRIPGPAAEVMRVGCHALLARVERRTVEERIASARAAAALCLSDPDRPLGLSVRLSRAWWLLTRKVVDRIWAAVRERRPPPYDLDQLQRELRAARQSGARAMVLLCLGRTASAAQVERTKGSLLDVAIQVEILLTQGEAAKALALIETQSGHARTALSPAAVHAKALLGRSVVNDSTRGLPQWFPWHTPKALRKVIDTSWWWPGEGPVSGG